MSLKKADSVVVPHHDKEDPTRGSKTPFTAFASFSMAHASRVDGSNSTSGDCSIRNWTRNPRDLDNCTTFDLLRDSRDRPSASASIGQPLLTRSSAKVQASGSSSALLFRARQCNGVQPSSVATSVLAPRSMRSCVACLTSDNGNGLDRPTCDSRVVVSAHMMGVQPFVFGWFTSSGLLIRGTGRRLQSRSLSTSSRAQKAGF